jgi:hypothetical protein
MDPPVAVAVRWAVGSLHPALPQAAHLNHDSMCVEARREVRGSSSPQDLSRLQSSPLGTVRPLALRESQSLSETWRD